MNEEEKICKICEWKSNKDDFHNFKIVEGKETRVNVWICCDCWDCLDEEMFEERDEDQDNNGMLDPTAIYDLD